MGRVPRAPKARVTDHLWTCEELVEMIDRGGQLAGTE
jgi:hypothetical protein